MVARGMMVGIVGIWFMLLLLAIFDNALSTGLTLFAVFILGGAQVYLSYRLCCMALERKVY